MNQVLLSLCPFLKVLPNPPPLSNLAIQEDNQDNKTKKTPIKIGYRSDGFIEIKEGLNQGERIVAEGLKKVRPNLKIKPITK